MVGLSSIKNLAQNAVSLTREASTNMAVGAVEDMGMAISEKIGLKDAVSNMVARPINAVKGLFAENIAPKPVSTMQKALNVIQKPSVIGMGVLGLGGLYALGRMTETPEASKEQNSDKKGA